MTSTPSHTLRILLPITLIAAAAVAVLVWAPWSTDDSMPDDSGTIPVSVLDDGAGMGLVELNVTDLPLVRDYYEAGIGLLVQEETADSVVLGLGDQPLVRLIADDGEAPAPGDAGLYHTAILYPDASSLADALVHLGPEALASFQGASDHRVSHAFYFADPEGNGIELYADTPAADWEWVDGQVTMGSFPLDPNEFIDEHATGTPPMQADMGHVHLSVGDIDLAHDFYVDALGFAVTSRPDSGGALFMAVGGYHHHLAVNTWNSAGAGQRTTSRGLRSLTVTLPSPGVLSETVDRVAAAGHSIESTDTEATVLDPWGNRVVLAVAPS